VETAVAAAMAVVAAEAKHRPKSHPILWSENKKPLQQYMRLQWLLYGFIT
jgi:hypothetical protein